MKKIVVIVILTVMSLILTSCSRSNDAVTQVAKEKESGSLTETQNEEVSTTNNVNPKILVAYFSRVGNTNFEEGVDVMSSASLNTDGSTIIGNSEMVVNVLVEKTSGELFLIETVNKYPADYSETTDLAKKEQNDDARPELASQVEDMDQFDMIMLVYPNWWGTLPQPVFTFLESYEFSNKTIIPIATHDGSALGRGPQDIGTLAPDATLLDGLAINGAKVGEASEDIASWIDELGIIE